MMTKIEAKYIDHMGTDLSVVNAARVSFQSASNWVVDMEKCTLGLSPRDQKLITYLATHKHTSPFGHAFLSFHVKAPVFVARQLVKHKFLRWNEVSRRYVDAEPEFYKPDVWRCRAEDKKQGSQGEHDMLVEKADSFDGETYTVNLKDWGKENERSTLALYNLMVSEGVAPEMARMVLPQSMFTEWYWSGSLDAFADMCNLRCKEDTQLETRLVAEDIDGIASELFPHAWKALRC